MKKSIFNHRDEEEEIAIGMGKLELHFLKWEQLRVNYDLFFLSMVSLLKGNSILRPG